jgi:hypothetical protein
MMMLFFRFTCDYILTVENHEVGKVYNLHEVFLKNKIEQKKGSIAK